MLLETGRGGTAARTYCPARLALAGPVDHILASVLLAWQVAPSPPPPPPLLSELLQLQSLTRSPPSMGVFAPAATYLVLLLLLLLVFGPPN